MNSAVHPLALSPMERSPRTYLRHMHTHRSESTVGSVSGDRVGLYKNAPAQLSGALLLSPPSRRAAFLSLSELAVGAPQNDGSWGGRLQTLCEGTQFWPQCHSPRPPRADRERGSYDPHGALLRGCPWAVARPGAEGVFRGRQPEEGHLARPAARSGSVEGRGPEGVLFQHSARREFSLGRHSHYSQHLSVLFQHSPRRELIQLGEALSLLPTSLSAIAYSKLLTG